MASIVARILKNGANFEMRSLNFSGWRSFWQTQLLGTSYQRMTIIFICRTWSQSPSKHSDNFETRPLFLLILYSEVEEVKQFLGVCYSIPAICFKEFLKPSQSPHVLHSNNSNHTMPIHRTWIRNPPKIVFAFQPCHPDFKRVPCSKFYQSTDQAWQPANEGVHSKKCWSSIKLKNTDESQSGLYKCVEETGKVVKVYEVEVVGKLVPDIKTVHV